MSSQVFGNPHQIGCEPFCTQVVQAFGDHPQGIIHRCPVGPPSLLATGLTFQLALQQSDQTLAMQFGDSLHFVQQSPSFFAVDLCVALLHPA